MAPASGAPWCPAIWRTSVNPDLLTAGLPAATRGAVEGFEHPLTLYLGDTRPVVAHGKLSIAPTVANLDGHRRCAVAQRVLDQVAYEAGEQPCITPDQRCFARQGDVAARLSTLSPWSKAISIAGQSVSAIALVLSELLLYVPSHFPSRTGRPQQRF
jgi:hypothetical protein